LYGTNDSQSYIATEEELKIANAKKIAEKYNFLLLITYCKFIIYILLLIRERNEILTDLKKRKSEYNQGLWNPETVLLGGLGNDPKLDAQDDPVIKLQESLLIKKDKLKKIQFFKVENIEEREEYKYEYILCILNYNNFNNFKEKKQKLE